MGGCRSRVTEMTFFDLVGLTLIQSVSRLRVIVTLDLVHLSNDECSLFLLVVWLGQSTQKANCVIIKIISNTQPEDVKSLS